MAFRILVLTKNTGNSEDYNLNYVSYLMVSSDVLDFSEPVFTDGTFQGDEEHLSTYLKGLGYAVQEQAVYIVELQSADE